MEMVQIAGVALAAYSLGALVQARMQLGKSFAVTPQAKELVTHGLYSKLQHPMYVFVDLAVCGIAMATRWWYILLLLVILIPLQLRNARKEAKLLGEKFGEQYEVFRRNTWF
jgi:protein-S-isoprenylcysteine O-methyltransferase Ste14